MHYRIAPLFSALLLAAPLADAGVVDAKLLEMLRANGSISDAQFAELKGDLAQEERKAKRAARDQVSKKEYTALTQKIGWAANTMLRGDMRVRQDLISIQDEPDNGGRDQDRQRIRARLAAVTQVNPEVEMGIQLASGSSADRRSTNQSMDGYFDKKAVWIDQAYIDYHPIKVPGLKLFAGKMKQPWMAIADMAWDGDINPEGFAAAYTRKNGTTTLFGSVGYYVLKDNIDGDGVQFHNDLSLSALQIGTAFDAGDSVRLTLGASLNDFDNEQPAAALRVNGNTTDSFRLYEAFGQMDVIGLPLPLSLYTQLVKNDAARDFATFTDGDEDFAWLFGLRTNIGGVAFDYNYRDVEANAVVGSLTDSDFASGYTASSGHKIKLSYDFLKNFQLAVSYFITESDAASRFNADDAGADTLMIDLNAKF